MEIEKAAASEYDFYTPPRALPPAAESCGTTLRSAPSP